MAEDKRFTKVISDPKYRHVPKTSRKVKIDKRFQSMFKDKKFNVNYTVDKRGRPIIHNTKEDYKNFYELSSEEESSGTSDSDEEDENDETDLQTTAGRFVRAPEIETETSSALDIQQTYDKKVSNKIKKKLKNLTVDYARGETNLGESSSDDEESEEEAAESDGEAIEHEWGEFDADAESTEEATNRLAACNMDWDRMRATDLMVLFNSFLPQGTSIKSVAIYPSEFGKQRMQEEEVKGPIELVESNTAEEEIENDDEEGSKYHMEKLRKYQLNRLKYYYAVITFDSIATANKVYTECDGMEYESSATKLDLRFIPDNMTFEDEPKETCDELPDLAKYQPRFFTNSALQQAKVDLTWDETAPDRIEFAQKMKSGKLEDVTDADLQHFVASSSGEDSEEESEKETKDECEGPKKSVDKYRALLAELEEKEKKKQESDIQMEVKWDIDLREKSEKLVKKKLEENEEKTPFEKYLDKRKAKRKERKQRKKESANGESEDDDSDIPDGIDMNDPYFAEEFDKPEFKKAPKAKRKHSIENSDSDGENAALELLLTNQEEDGKKHFSLKKIQEQDSNKKKSKKRQKKEQSDSKNDDFAINVEDDRFSALFTSHHYNIDPTNPHFKKTKNMEVLINEKIKRRNNESVPQDDVKEAIPEKKNPELNMLIKSVKQKTINYKNK